MPVFYCTAGRGTEKFVKAELLEVLDKRKLEKVNIVDGKVFVQGDFLPSELINLKTVERVMLVVADETYHRSHMGDIDCCLNPQCYIGKPSLWTNSRIIKNLSDICKINKFQTEPAKLGSCDIHVPHPTGVSGVEPVERTEKSVPHPSGVIIEPGERTETSVPHPSGVIIEPVERTETSVPHPSGVIIEPGERTVTSVPHPSGVIIEPGERTVTSVPHPSGVIIEPGERTVTSVPHPSGVIIEPVERTETSVPHPSGVIIEPGERTETSVPHLSLTEEDQTFDSNERIFKGTFRVNCRCCRQVTEEYDLSSEFVQQDFGKWMRSKLKWISDLRSPDIQINIYLKESGILVGIPVTRIPLSKRLYVKHFGLRSTISYIMMSLLPLKNGDLVLDPLCGKATILVESGYENKLVLHLGCDRDESQLKYGTENVNHANLHNVCLFKGNALELPLPENYIDHVLCDAPFGLKYTIEEESFYSRLLREVCRVVKPRGKIVLLTIAAFRKFLIEKFSQLRNRKMNRGEEYEIDDFSFNSEIEDSNCCEKDSSKSLLKRLPKERRCNLKKKRLNNDDILPLFYIDSHYVKLGDTDAYICELVKTVP